MTSPRVNGATLPTADVVTPIKMTNNLKPIGWEPIPLDGGWGWVVVFGAFVIHVIADGIVYSFGVMMVELLDYFKAEKSLTSWILSLLVGLTLGTGPIASAVTNRYGCRASCMVGSVIASLGCGVSFFATSVWQLMLSIGVVVGLGFGLMYCPAIIIVTMYFEEKRSLATGITVCGAGLGTFIFAPLTSALIDKYTWRGAFLIFSGIILNCGVCGALFRPLEFSPVYEEKKEEEEEGEEEEYPTIRSKFLLREVSIDEEGSSVPIPIQGPPVVNPDAIAGFSLPPQQTGYLRMNSNRRIRGLSESLYPTRPDVSAHGPDRFIHVPESRFTSHIHKRTRDGMAVPTRTRIRGVSESQGYLHVKDVFFPGSLSHVHDFNREPELFRGISGLHKARPVDTVMETVEPDGRLIVQIDKARTESLPDDSSFLSRICTDFKEVVLEMVNLSILLDPLFLLFTISNFFTSIGFNAPLVFLPDFAQDKLHIEQTKASWILSGFGITNTLGRVFIGFVSDRYFPCRYGQNKAMNRLWIYNISLTMAGIITGLSFLFTDFISLTAYSALYGLFMSCYVCLTSVILVDLLGLSKLTNAFGILLLFQGLASVVGPPIAGWLRDTTGTYTWSFAFAGISIGLSGVILYIIPCIQQRQLNNLDNDLDRLLGSET